MTGRERLLTRLHRRILLGSRPLSRIFAGMRFALVLRTAFAVITLSSAIAACAADSDFKLLLSDDFEREEKDPAKEQVGNGWGTNSRTRAKGQKQVDLAGGAMRVTRAKVADHGVSVFHEVAFRDATIRLRFKLGKGDDLGINIADMKEKSVHAGHICLARVRLDRLEISDLKTGRMKKEHREARKAGRETAEQKKLTKARTRYFDLDLKPDAWHQLEVDIRGDRMQVSINDRKAGSFSAPGIGHPTKSRLRLAVNKSAWIDDVEIRGR